MRARLIRRSMARVGESSARLRYGSKACRRSSSFTSLSRIRSSFTIATTRSSCVPGVRGIIDGVAGGSAAGAVAGGGICGWLVAGVCIGGLAGGELADCADASTLSASEHNVAEKKRMLLVRVQPPTLRALSIAVQNACPMLKKKLKCPAFPLYGLLAV